MLTETQLVANKLNDETLTALLDEELLAIHIPKYICQSACETFVERFTAADFSYYEHENNTVGHLGLSAYDIDSDAEKLDFYYANVDVAENQRQEIFRAYHDPLERFKREIAVLYPPGIYRENFHGKPMFAGMLRRIVAGSCVMVHQDNIAWISNTDKAQAIQSQFAFNVYLQANARGGELLLWHDKYSESEFNQLSNNTYCFPFHSYRKPDVVIKPQTGDLVFFNAHYCHAVNHVQDEDRIALSAFFGCYGKDKPLTYWS